MQNQSQVGLLFIVFLILKLTHVIDWSWWWITAPLWIGAALAFVLLIVFGASVVAVKSISQTRR